MRHRGGWCLLAVVLWLLFTPTVRAELVVVVAVQSSIPMLERAEVRAIFLAKRSTTGDGHKVIAVYQSRSQPIYQYFNSLVLEKNNIKMRQFWARLIFAGKERRLRYLADNRAVKRFVRETLGGIGYIDRDAVDDTVRVVFELKTVDVEI